MPKHGKKPQQAGKIEYIKVGKLELDPTINIRPLDEKRSDRIAKTLDIDALGVVTASKRADGRYIILDGQHRVEALRILGWSEVEIAVKVFTGLTIQEEAEIFVQLNSQVAIRFIDQFMARLTMGEKSAVAIDQIVKQNGYVIDRKGRDGTIAAAGALEKIYLGTNQKIRGANAEALHGTLQAVTSAWGRTGMAVKADVLLGVGAFLLRHGNTIKLTRLIEKLKSTSGGPQGLVSRGKGKRELHGGTLPSGIGHYLTEDYNKGLRGRGKLTAWRD